VYWDDADLSGDVTESELIGPFETGRVDLNNHGFGITIQIEHAGSIYSQYSHLHAVTKRIYEEVFLTGGSVTVTRGEVIGVLGGSWYDDLDGRPPHLHLEIKDEPELGTPIAEDDGTIYYAYLADRPDAYGFHDPFRFMLPFDEGPAVQVPFRVIGQEAGRVDECTSDIPNRGVRIYGGPGGNYSILGWTGLGQRLIADRAVVGARPGDRLDGRLWYRIRMPNNQGVTSGWVPTQTTDGTDLIAEDPTAITVEVDNQTGGGLYFGRAAGVDCASDNSECLRVWNKLRSKLYPVPATDALQFVANRAQMVDGEAWVEIDLPALYFDDPGFETACAPRGDNAPGEIRKAWLPAGGLRIVSP